MRALVAFLFATAGLAGCFGGGDDASDPSTVDDTAKSHTLPEGLEMENAELIGYNGTSVVWRWTSTAGPDAAGVASTAPGTSAGTPFDLPRGFPTIIRAEVNWSASDESALDLRVLAADGMTLCTAAPAPWKAPSADCGAVHPTLAEPGQGAVVVTASAAATPVDFAVRLELSVGTVVPPPARPQEPTADERAALLQTHQVVVGIADTGINPYHASFRDDSPSAYVHPSTYIEGFPQDAVALNLTLGASTYLDALRADWDTWQNVEEGVLYWIPGTKIIGAIMPEPPVTAADSFCGPVRDCYFHGTGVASRAVSDEYGLCGACRLVAVQGFQSGLEWMAPREWVDVSLLSYRYHATEGRMGDRAEDEELLSMKPTFVPSGNAKGTDSIIVGIPTTLSHWQGLPSVISVGAHDNGRVVAWSHTMPHVAADGYTWFAAHESMEGRRLGDGTSFSAPYVAGAGAALVLEARRILDDPVGGVHEGVLAEGEPEVVADGPLADGAFTIEEFRDLLFTTADPRPSATPHDGPACNPQTDRIECAAIPPTIPLDQLPGGVSPYYFIGYGGITPETLEHAKAVLRGEEPMPERPVEDAFFALDHEVRKALVEVDP